MASPQCFLQTEDLSTNMRRTSRVRRSQLSSLLKSGFSKHAFREVPFGFRRSETANCPNFFGVPNSCVFFAPRPFSIQATGGGEKTQELGTPKIRDSWPFPSRGTVPGATLFTSPMPQECTKISPKKHTWHEPQNHACIARFWLRSASQGQPLSPRKYF